MGQEIDKDRFNKQDFSCFAASLTKETAQLNTWFSDAELSSHQAVGGFEINAVALGNQDRRSLLCMLAQIRLPVDVMLAVFFDQGMGCRHDRSR